MTNEKIANDYCGQKQPHGAHQWQTIRYGSFQATNIHQCAGVVTPVEQIVDAKAVVRAIAERACYPQIGEQGNGHTSAYAVRQWLHWEADHIAALSEEDT